jgi:transposase
MSATPNDCITVTTTLGLAFELGWNEWKLAFSTSRLQAPRLRTIRARDLAALAEEIAKAKARFGLSAETPVISCYEAGRDGFWLHRWLTKHDIQNHVFDASSIDRSSRRRQAKTDRLDVGKLLTLLWRHLGGERDAVRIVTVPSVENEDGRHLHRSLQVLKGERTAHINRIKGTLASVGLAVEVNGTFGGRLDAMRTWDGQPLGSGMVACLRDEFERWQLVDRQIREQEKKRIQEVRTQDSEERVRKMLTLKAIGMNTAWLLDREFFGWRAFRNRRELGALAGLTPVPYQSGNSERSHGISKAGNRRLRAMMIEVAWMWLRWQPGSRLSEWYMARFGTGSSRQRRIGIVALARKLLVAVWRFLESGEVPDGAVLVDWRTKLKIG